ncbi:MAG: TlpA family protein disulfide reductase [Verrucomicrobia bacterium]|nr:TlpA family protein disulfide reductase [Verrucomicrobiota bacterium]
MIKKTLFVFVVAALTLSAGPAIAAEKTNPKADLQALVVKVKEKLKQEKNTEQDLADELKEFDALLEKHKADKTDEVAEILFMKAVLYLEIMENFEKALDHVKRLKTDFPDTKRAKGADDMITLIQKQDSAHRMQKSLVVGAKFPDFEEKDIAGKLLSIANYKGKVVLVDFWATWCGPCIGELPNVLKTYEKHHGKGFEIIGISLDKDEAALTGFIKKRNMGWQQFFDGKGWENKLAEKYGILSIPATFLLDGEGKIVAKDLRGEALEAEVAKLVAKP